MKRLLVVVLVAGLAVALYASTAGGGQQAVTPGQFAALKKQVATLQKQMKTANKNINLLESVAVAFIQCDFSSAVPVTNSPSLHVTNPGEGTDAYVVTTTKECADAMNSPTGALKKLLAHR